MSTQQHRKPIDPMAVILWIVLGIPGALVFCWLAYIFVSVVFLGRSSSCPQNLC